MDSVSVVRRKLHRMVQGVPLNTAALYLFSKRGIACHGDFRGNIQSLRCLAGNGIDNRGAGNVLKLSAAGQDVETGSLGIGYRSGNSGGKEPDDCRDPNTMGKQLKVSGIRPTIGHSMRNFCGTGTDQNRVMVVKPEEGNEELEDSLKVVEYLNSLRNFEKEGVPKGAGTESDAGFDLQRMSRLLISLGDPLNKYPVVHVAGTKGKGSTVSFLSQILRAAGFRVGSYTSPHIHSLRERIVSGTTGQPISTKVFNQLFDDVKEIVHEAVITEAGALTHFEVLTALAFVHFAREKVDMAVIEAGLGGARDATNVIPASSLLAAVIVAIGEEHLEALGGSLESVALAKAGIIKHRRPVVMGKQTESAAEHLIRQVAASKYSVVLPQPGKDAIYNMKGICAESFNARQICDISIHETASDESAGAEDEVWEVKDLKIPALGAHQLDNVAAAIQTALCLRKEGWKISDAAIRLGVERTTIPGRFQFSTPVEAMNLGSRGSTVILDGAHTPGSGAALARTIKELFPKECVAMVVAMASDKDHQGFARAILEGGIRDQDSSRGRAWFSFLKLRLGTKCKIIVTTSVDIASSLQRSTSPRALLNSFRRGGKDLNMIAVSGPTGNPDTRSALELLPASASEFSADSTGIKSERKEQLFLVEEADSIKLAIERAAQLIHELNEKRPGVICITGSLHAVSTTLSLSSTIK